MMDVVGGIFLVFGALFILLAGVGAVRFTDIYARMHAAAKAPALGVILVGIGTALSIRTVQAVVAAVLVIGLQLITGPVGSHLLGRAVYRHVSPPLDGPDELADAEAAGSGD
jgi:multicomponent Na+:H+ antiporter subunit G